MRDEDTRKVVRPAVDYKQVKLLRDDPKEYFEEDRESPKLPFGFAKTD